MKTANALIVLGLSMFLACPSIGQSLNPSIPASRSASKAATPGSSTLAATSKSTAKAGKKSGKDCDCDDDKPKRRTGIARSSAYKKRSSSYEVKGWEPPRSRAEQPAVTGTASLTRGGYEFTGSPMPRPDTVFVEKKTPVKIIPYPFTLPIDKQAIKGAYVLGLSDHKTTHIIFPSKIKVFDAGSADVLAVVPEAAGNVLQAKSSEAKPFEQTNMTVLLEDGGFFSFLVHYDPNPPVLNLNVLNNMRMDRKTSQDLGINQAYGFVYQAQNAPNVDELSYFAKKTVNQKRFVKNVGATSLKVNARATALYVHGNSLYIQLTIENDSEIDYNLDFTKFYIRDKSVMKRVAQQEIELVPQMYFPEEVTVFKADSKYVVCYAIPLKTFTIDKVLDVEIYEKQGSRHLRFPIEADVFIKAKSF